MRRFLLLTIIALSAAVGASAQLRYGLDLGLEVSRLSFSKSVADAKNRAGFFVGPKIHAKIPKLGLGADIALRYAQKNAAIEVYNTQETEIFEKEQMHYIEVPLNVRWDISILKAFGVFVATGPQWDWYIGPSTWESTEQFKATFNHHTLGWNVGTGIMLFNRLNLSVSYHFPITDQGDFVTRVYNTVARQVEDAKVDMNSHSWQISLSFFFNK